MSLKKALLILVQYPALGAPRLQQTLLVLLLLPVGFLRTPSEDEYPELSTPLKSLWLGLKCNPGLVELLSPA